MKQTKGFTLIELLVVIGIIAVLSVVVILTLNPAELLRQARDSTRLSDLSTVQTAIALYSSQANTIGFGDGVNCYIHTVSGNSNGMSSGCFSGGTGAQVRFTSGPLPGVASGVTVAKNTVTVDGLGWLPIDMKTANLSSGLPVSAWPVDPINVTSTDLFYAYRPSSTLVAACTGSAGNACNSYEINAVMESGKYSNLGANDVESKDGGTNINLYEVGTNLAL